MENSKKPSSSSVQDVAQSPKKKSLSNKNAKKMSPMKAAKIPVEMQKPKKSLAKITKKMPLEKAAKAPTKKQAGTLKKSNTTSEENMKTRAASNRASLDSLMAGFQSEGRAKTALGMPLKDFSESAVALLMSNYKVENEKVLSTTALAM